MRLNMEHDVSALTLRTGSDRERGAAIIIAIMVSLILAFLGLGLLLQTSLGMQAAGTDRWVVRALYAADAGAQAEIATLANGAVGMGSFVLADDTALPGMLNGQYNITVSDVCELQTATDAYDPLEGAFYEVGKWKARHVHFRSTATRDVGLLVGLTQATIVQDVRVQVIDVDTYIPAPTCN